MSICTIDAQGEKYETLQLYEKKVGELHNSIYDQLEDELIHENLEATLFTKGKYFVMILQFANYGDNEIDKITEFIQKVQANLQGDSVFHLGSAILYHPLKKFRPHITKLRKRF